MSYWLCRKVSERYGGEPFQLRNQNRLQTHDDWKAGKVVTYVLPLARVCISLKILTIIYKQNSPEEEAELKKLKEIEKSVEQTAKKLENVDGELTGLKNVRNQFWLLTVLLLCSPVYSEETFLLRASWPKTFKQRH